NTGKRAAPSLAAYVSTLTDWVERYNNTPHDALDGATPASLWAALERTPLHARADAIVRPREQRIVRRSCVQLHNREYDHPELIAYNGEEVLVEYDLHNDNAVRILDMRERWLADAFLVRKAEYLPASRVQEASERRLEGQRKRLARKLNEVEARSIRSISHDEKTADIERMNATFEVIEEAEEDEWDAMTTRIAKNLDTGAPTPMPEEDERDLPLDVLKTDY
ncbi:MAG: Mu transposase C-terminal domain-containing protein, partial [Gammaproteobacteria bacterium]|nr:Mu transposase C-terminal domain-containing protein [Gammaproteobacteria bacterium]